MLEVEVVGRGLELVRHELPRLGDQFLGRIPECRPADRDAAAAVGVETERRNGCVSVQHVDLIDPAAEPVCNDLGPHRLVTLPVR